MLLITAVAKHLPMSSSTPLRRGAFASRRAGYPWWGSGTGIGLLAAALGSSHHASAQGFFNPFAEPGATVAFPIPQSGSFTELPGTDGDAGDNFLIQGGIPYNPVVGRGVHQHYRLKLGRATGSITTGIALTYVDNANLVSADAGGAPQSDLSITSSVGVGFNMPLDRDNTLQLNLGIGYSHHFNQNQPDQLSISPTTQWDYRMNLGSIRLTFYDRVSTPGTVGPGAQISGSGSFASINFHRLDNNIGMSAAWQKGKSTTYSAGYDLTTDIGLGDKFAQQDHLTHSLSLALFERLDRRWTVGVSGSAYENQFFERFQNDSQGFGVGPTLTWQPTRRFNLSASARYSLAISKPTGVVADTRGFAGLTYDVNAEQYLTSRLAHGLGGGSHVDLGIGSNFAKTLTGNYHLAWRWSPRVAINFISSYIQSGQSGTGYDFIPLPNGALFIPGATPQLLTSSGLTPLPVGTLLTPGGLLAQPRAAEDSQQIIFAPGIGFQVTDNLTASLSYSYRIRLSNLTGHDYAQNSVTGSLSYAF